MEAIETDARSFSLIRGSDVQRDGMYLELSDTDARKAVAEVFYSDKTGRMSFSAYEEDISLEAIELLIERSKQLLPPATSSLRGWRATGLLYADKFPGVVLGQPLQVANRN